MANRDPTEDQARYIANLDVSVDKLTVMMQRLQRLIDDKTEIRSQKLKKTFILLIWIVLLIFLVTYFFYTYPISFSEELVSTAKTYLMKEGSLESDLTEDSINNYLLTYRLGETNNRFPVKPAVEDPMNPSNFLIESLVLKDNNKFFREQFLSRRLGKLQFLAFELFKAGEYYVDAFLTWKTVTSILSSKLFKQAENLVLDRFNAGILTGLVFAKIPDIPGNLICSLKGLGGFIFWTPIAWGTAMFECDSELQGVRIEFNRERARVEAPLLSLAQVQPPSSPIALLEDAPPPPAFRRRRGSTAPAGGALSGGFFGCMRVDNSKFWLFKMVLLLVFFQSLRTRQLTGRGGYEGAARYYEDNSHTRILQVFRFILQLTASPAESRVRVLYAAFLGTADEFLFDALHMGYRPSGQRDGTLIGTFTSQTNYIAIDQLRRHMLQYNYFKIPWWIIVPMGIALLTFPRLQRFFLQDCLAFVWGADRQLRDAPEGPLREYRRVSEAAIRDTIGEIRRERLLREIQGPRLPRDEEIALDNMERDLNVELLNRQREQVREELRARGLFRN